jgi:hypothetical protein
MNPAIIEQAYVVAERDCQMRMNSANFKETHVAHLHLFQ